MKALAIDIETFSSTDLTKSGVYKYVADPDFCILLFAYSSDHGPVEIIDLANGEIIPEHVLIALEDPVVVKTAHNANFERTCIAMHFFIELPPEQWECTMTKASMLGLPLSLDTVGKVLKLSQQKDTLGKQLIRYFCIPCKPTKTNGNRTRNLPAHSPEKWESFKGYCKQDVAVELAIIEKVEFFQITQKEKQLWCLDQRINDTGILLDPTLIKNAIRMDYEHREKLATEAIKLTGLDNPNSAAQLKSWISEEMGDSVTSLTKTAIPELLKQTNCNIVKRVLQIRQEMSKTSVKKYESMSKVIGADNRARGLLQYYGANRTGRWAGRLVQVQNLPTNSLKDLDLARNLVMDGDSDGIELLYGNLPDTLSQLVRTAFIPSNGCRFIVADFSAIEARVIAWLAGEKWRMDVFNTHGKIYEASAAQMFKIPIQDVTKDSPYRKKGKIAELALGFNGGPNALIKMGALNMGLVEEELPKIVAMWRNVNKAICKYWETVGDAALEAVKTGPVTISHGITFYMNKGSLFIKLPSGRELVYLRPQIRDGKYGDMLVYEGMDQTTKQWKIVETYGGKLVENIVQAVARDCLAEGLLRLDRSGYKIVMHVHDEIVMDMPCGIGSAEDVNRIMTKPIEWAKGLPLRADCHEITYYKKD
ncbi:MAG TPA: DNA polymerase [Chitinophagaceae bacterium]|nr:DNA polymerase [Chitinophagaceae bacterium]